MNQEDVWIPTTCSICYSYCALKAHRVNGVVVKLEGNPDCPTSNGRLCPRGLSGIMLLYDHSRVNVPLKRTNPEKGIGVDPKWKEISWDEALDTFAEKLIKVREDDPRKLLGTGTVSVKESLLMAGAFTTAFGSPNFWSSASGSHCGKGEHLMGALVHASWARMPDTNYMNYFLNFGCPVGFGAYYTVTGMSQRMAEARVRGMKHVVIDPWMSTSAEKADEWIPIKPGTDAALALAMVNILLNELGVYDSEAIKHHTNGPYLVGPEGFFVRDGQNQKPMVWDSTENKAKVYDDPTIKDFALEGEYRVEGVTARPAFSLIKEHVKTYSADYASRITTIPADTIRRLAKEFGQAARVGSKINIDGVELPYRPVGVAYFKGAQAHKHCALICMALELLGEIVGASNVPGGMLGINSRSFGLPITGFHAYDPKVGKDGGLVTGEWLVRTIPDPFAEPRKPESMLYGELVPTTFGSSPLVPLIMLEPEKYGIPYHIECQLQIGSNYVMTAADPKLMARAFKDVFTVAISLYLDESTELADIVLPDACYLERLDSVPDIMSNNLPVDAWAYHVRQPVVKPLFKRRPLQEIVIELAERVGMRDDLNAILNLMLRLRKPYTMQPGTKYSWEEMVHLQYKSFFGPEHDLEWFKKNGVLTRPKKVDETYWRPFIKARVPIYFESFKKLGQEVEKAKREYGLTDFDTSDFVPLPDWKPCPGFETKNNDYDLLAIYYRVPVHTLSATYNIPWLDEVSSIDPYIYRLAINSSTANKKGIRDDDWVELESLPTGNKIKVRARLTEAIHPEVVALANCGGHWSKYMPIASQPGKGACFEWLLPLSFDHLDTLTYNMDLCVRVKASKVEARM